MDSTDTTLLICSECGVGHISSHGDDIAYCTNPACRQALSIAKDIQPNVEEIGHLILVGELDLLAVVED